MRGALPKPLGAGDRRPGNELRPPGGDRDGERALV
jgi:hypothetical protein